MGWRKSKNPNKAAETSSNKNGNDEIKLFSFEPMNRLVHELTRGPNIAPVKDNKELTRTTSLSSMQDEHIEPTRKRAKPLGALAQSKYAMPIVLLLGLGLLGLIGFAVYDMLRVPEHACPSPGQPSVGVERGRKVVIGPSSEGDVCIIQGDTVLGRSYNGLQWEESTSVTKGFSCSSNGKCSVFMPSDSTFRLTTYYPPSTSSEERDTSRFLVQASFGPLTSEIKSWGSKTFKDWIVEQQNLPASLHRSYFRRRVNQRTAITTGPGRPRDSCENASRWHRHTFTKNDVGKNFEVSSSSGSRIAILMNGQVRVELDRDDWGLPAGSSFKICEVEEIVGGEIEYGSGDCTEKSENPALHFETDPARLMTLDSSEGRMEALEAPVDNVLVLKLSRGSRLESCSFPGRDPVYVVNPTNEFYYQHDKRLVMSDNTLASPAEGTTAEGSYCVQAPKTFLNIESCVVGGRSCAPERYTSESIVLNDENIRRFYTEGGHFVYRMEGLRSDMHRPPCDKRQMSRWLNVPCSDGNDNANVDADTLATFVNAFTESTDPNPKVRDVQVNNGDDCDGSVKIGATLSIAGECWKNVHPQMFNVYDLSWWTELHRKPEEITQPAEINEHTYLRFPERHGSRQWDQNHRKFSLLGRFMDTVDFSKLPSTVQSRAMASFFDVSETTSSEDDYTERCGSPGEVANDPGLGARYSIGLTTSSDFQNRDRDTLDARMDSKNFKTSAWTMNAVFAKDQLRQRMAFALSQILVISESQLGHSDTEIYLAYYDIFVRNAFGSYKDILMEVSFSPMMADMLTFLQTKSFEYSLRRFNREVFPDENYAREIMQLFSIGLLQLNNDGSSKTDANGNALETYTNEDIIAFSRAWTGFDRQKTRGNIESVKDVNSPNRIDPMRIVPEYRDKFPKMDLFKGHIGDGYPLCIDLPDKMFLRTGAKWIYLGKNPMPTKVQDPDDFRLGNDVKRVVLDTSSELYEALCNRRGGRCRFKSYVRLIEKLPCTGIECNVDTMRVVNVDGAYYEYVRPPCIRFPFFNKGIKIQEAHWRGAMCAHPKEIVAAEACCDDGESEDAIQDCLYAGERLSFATAQARCAASGKGLCDFVFTKDSCYFHGHHWTNAGCKVHVKVSKDDGKVAVVHDPEPGPSRTRTKKDMERSVREDTRNWFRVAWKDGRFPSPGNGCSGACSVTETNDCLCTATVTESAVFKKIPSRRELISSLHIGSIAPELFDDGEYTVLPESTDEVKAYIRRGGSPFDQRTVFSAVVKGEEVYFVNMESTVVLLNGNNFRNPANLMGIAKATVRDAEYETEAVIDHFFKHPNCPPFVAYRIIQRFVTSNPSPRYVDVCAKAFATGSYESIGSGKYGDLGALIAAVLLDREARETLLDADPVHGQMREPLLKIIHVLRSLEVLPRGNREIELDNIQGLVGEMAHKAPDVFSFFKPEYSPPGPLATALLAGPEAQVFTGPKVVALFNGLISLVRLGLTDCYNGFGNHYESHSCYHMNRGEHDAFRISPAMLSWSPESSNEASIVDEISLLLTAGRLGNSTRDLIIQQVEEEASDNGLQAAILVAQQLLLASPEFHVSTIVQRSGARGKTDETFQNGTRPYKAIVYLMLSGGMDSFNLIVPHSRCKGGKNKYEEYKAVRTDIALAHEDLLQIEVEHGTQVCDVFGVHPSLPRLHQQYGQGNAIFMANVGPLVEPITKEDIQKGAKRRPTSLFSHNIQQQSAQTMVPQGRINTGVMGRINDALHDQGYVTSSFSISGKNFVQEGVPGGSPPQNFMDGRGVRGLDPARSSDRFTVGISEMNGNFAESFHAETWAATVSRTLAKTEILQDILDNTELEQPWTSTNGYSRQLNQVAKIIKSRAQLGSDRQTFFTAMGGFDTHNNIGSSLANRFEQINEAISLFEEEMKLQGLWENVVFIAASEFGRTITSNGAGTDHGWGGNYFMVGGGVMGGKIIGEYPQDLSTQGKENLGRGRLVPSTSWDAIWNAVAMWFGVEVERMTDVLPNRRNFEGQLFYQNELFGTHDPFRQWAVVLSISILLALVGLAILLAASRKRDKVDSNKTPKSKARGALRTDKSPKHAQGISKAFGRNRENGKPKETGALRPSTGIFSSWKMGGAKPEKRKVEVEEGYKQNEPAPKLKNLPVFAKVPFWTDSGANPTRNKRAPKLAELPPIRKSTDHERKEKASRDKAANGRTIIAGKLKNLGRPFGIQTERTSAHDGGRPSL